MERKSRGAWGLGPSWQDGHRRRVRTRRHCRVRNGGPSTTTTIGASRRRELRRRERATPRGRETPTQLYRGCTRSANRSQGRLLWCFAMGISIDSHSRKDKAVNLIHFSGGSSSRGTLPGKKFPLPFIAWDRLRPKGGRATVEPVGRCGRAVELVPA